MLKLKMTLLHYIRTLIFDFLVFREKDVISAVF